MSIPFGPRLIGETEKTLNALLRHVLTGTDRTEPQWVALQLAGELAGSVDTTGLTDAVHAAAGVTQSKLDAIVDVALTSLMGLVKTQPAP